MEKHNQLGLRSVFLLLALSCTLWGISGCGEQAESNQAQLTEAEIVQVTESLNILFVILDAASRDHCGFYGYDQPTTPNLDAVAAEAVVFENAYAQASGTMLSVYSYFTSRYPVFGEDLQTFLRSALVIESQMTTMAEIMGRVFPHRLGATSNGHLQSAYGHGQGFTSYWHSWELPDPGKSATHRDRRLIHASISWLKEHAEEGFFAYLHCIKPHVPYNPPPSFLARFTDEKISSAEGSNGYIQQQLRQDPTPDFYRRVTNLYDGNLAHIDDEIGWMIEELKAAGIWDQTIFVLTADHGEGLGEHSKLMGHGDFVYEEVVRVPLLIRMPGLPALAGLHVQEPVELVDLLPSLMALKAIPQEGEDMAGRSLLPLLAKAEDAGSEGHRFVHSRTNKLIPPIFTVRQGNLKLIYHQKTGELELYDLAADPVEQQNLMTTAGGQQLAKPLDAYLQAWIQARGEIEDFVHSVPVDSLDEKTKQNLRALGYID